MWAKWEVRSQKEEKIYRRASGIVRMLAFMWSERGSFLCSGSEQRDLTCSIASPLLLNWKWTLRRQGLLWIIWMSDGDNLVQEK